MENVPKKSEKLGHELLNACYFGNIGMAIRLIKRNANPAYIDPRDGWSCIHYAARWGKLRIISELLKAGADINMRTANKETALHKACRSNRKDTCVWLMLHGSDPTLLNGEGNRASDVTGDDDVKYVCNHFYEFYTKLKSEKKMIETNKKDKK
jgi:ankyrin repeat protein